MSRTHVLLEEKRRLRAEYGELYDEISALLFRHAPVGINFETNTDEYEPEVGTILPRLHSRRSEGDANRVVHEEFVSRFGAESSGPRERYAQIATQIWQLWQKVNAA